MARILFVPHPETGHVNATLGLAKQLKARGHEVGYLGLPDVEELLRSKDWSFTPVAEHLFPKGAQAENLTRVLERGLPREQVQAIMAEHMRRHREYLSEMLFGTQYEERLRQCGADLLIVDATFPMPALVALKLGIPVFLLCTNLPLGWDGAVPPLSSHHIPTGSLLSKLRIQLAWRLLGAAGGLGESRRLRELVRRFFHQHRELVEPYDFRSHFQFGPNLRLPTLVTCVPEFDFPRRSRENLHYLGPCIDRERPEAPLPEWVDSGTSPLLYCSLGSHGIRVLRHGHFFEAVIAAMARKPDWRLLLAVGKGAASFEGLPANVKVVDSAPQLAVLQRASLMITHGGLNSVKECISMGVPMIAYPLMFDQPGNAARIVHHGLGLRGDIRRATVETFSSRIDTVASEPGFRARVQAMQRRFLAADESGRGADTVERLLEAQVGRSRPALERAS